MFKYMKTRDIQKECDENIRNAKWKDQTFLEKFKNRCRIWGFHIGDYEECLGKTVHKRSTRCHIPEFGIPF
jgi:hypothetical protein